MFKIRGGLAVILTTVTGIVLIIVALNAAQEAMKIETITKDETFTITGKAYFSERYEQKMWRPKKYVYVSLKDYPATFIIGRQSPERSAAIFRTAIDTLPIKLIIPKAALALLPTRSTLTVYELATVNGKTIFSFDEARERDKRDRLRLYLMAGFCFLGGLVLLIVPKRYLLKQ